MAAGEVHVWRKSLQCCDECLWARLNDDEVERAKRFRFDRDRDRFVTARATLRLLLGRYLDTEPREVAFRYGSKGKPELADTLSSVRFNLAHSHEVALYAFALGMDIGVDIERVRARITEERIPERFFARRETNALRSLPVADQREAFFRCWTRKEAFLKANGEGLAFGLNQFAVSVLQGENLRILETPYDPDEADRWSLYDLKPGFPYVGALALRGKPERIRYWEAGEPIT